MGSYILCHEKQADVPYYIKEIGTNLWTIEELCYYVCQYVWMLDESFLQETLCDWIDKQLLMPKLAKQLYAELYRGHSLKKFIEILLNYTGYADKDKINELLDLLDGIEHATEMERLKKRGDYLLKDHKYRRAIGLYNEILDMRRNVELSRSFYSQVWNNKGLAYAKLFLFDETYTCMKKAYEEFKTSFSKDALLASIYCMDFDRFEILAKEHGFDEKDIFDFIDRQDVPIHADELQDVKMLKHEYERDNN